jgi:hypothetical protein
LKVDQEFKQLIPPLTQAEKDRLRDNLKKEGCRDALVVWSEEDILLDGHNRLEICEEEGIEYRTTLISLPDRNAAEIWILENQTGRRNLNISQKAVLALELESRYAFLAKQRQGARTDIPGHCTGMSDLGREARDQAAEKFNIKGRQVSGAKMVRDKGVPDLFDAVKRGDVGVQAGERVTRLSRDLQTAVASRGPVMIKKASTVVHDLSSVEKITPGITEKAVVKVVAGEASTPKEAIEKALPDEDLRRFREFDRKTNAAVNEAVRGVTRSFNGAGKACFMPNVKELWCEDCEWGFDVFLPVPGEDISCPYCKGQNLIARDKEWYPGR